MGDLYVGNNRIDDKLYCKLCNKYVYVHNLLKLNLVFFYYIVLHFVEIYTRVIHKLLENIEI